MKPEINSHRIKMSVKKTWWTSWWKNVVRGQKYMFAHTPCWCAFCLLPISLQTDRQRTFKSVLRSTALRAVLQKKKNKRSFFFFLTKYKEAISLYISLSCEQLYDTNLMSQCKLNFFQMQQKQMPKRKLLCMLNGIYVVLCEMSYVFSFIHKQSTKREARNQHVSKLGIQCNVSQAIVCLNSKLSF